MAGYTGPTRRSYATDLRLFAAWCREGSLSLFTVRRAHLVHDLKAAASRDLLVGGPNLAAQAVDAGLVDELQLFIWPVVLGGRRPALPTDIRADLALPDEHRFSNGVVQLGYRLV